MKKYLKPAVIILALIACINSCDQSAEKKDPQPAKDTAVADVTPIVAPVEKNEPGTLKDIELNEKSVIGGRKLSASPKMNTETFNLLSIKEIDKSASTASGFKYHIVDTLFPKPGAMILLIGREYESENMIWMANYDSNNRLHSWDTLYYDNAEGFMSLESSIKNNEITISIYNEYAEDGKQKKKKVLRYDAMNNRILKL